MNDWPYEWMNEWATEWVIEWVTEWLTEWMTKWMSKWIAEWMTKWMSKWKVEWMTKWMSRRRDTDTSATAKSSRYSVLVNILRWNRLDLQDWIDHTVRKESIKAYYFFNFKLQYQTRLCFHELKKLKITVQIETDFCLICNVHT